MDWNSIEAFADLLEKKFRQVAQEDEAFVIASLLECSADIFERCELHLSELHEQLLLLFKRLTKLYEMRDLGSNMGKLGMESFVRTIDKEVEQAYAKDLDLVRLVRKEVDIAEGYTQSLVEYLYEDKRITSSLSREQFEEAKGLYQVVIKVRNLEKDLEEAFPVLKGE